MPLRGEARRKTYRIDERIGGGPATDDIYRAWHNVFQGPCVQKRVHVHGLEDALASNEPAFLDKLRHPHIVEVREAIRSPFLDDLQDLLGATPAVSLDDSGRGRATLSVVAVGSAVGKEYLYPTIASVHEVEEAFDWMATRSPEAAGRWRDAILETGDTLITLGHRTQLDQLEKLAGK